MATPRFAYQQMRSTINMSFRLTIAAGLALPKRSQCTGRTTIDESATNGLAMAYRRERRHAYA